MSRGHIPNVGELVAHRGLDDLQGGAKKGIVEDYVGDEESGIVVMRNEDGQYEGFDRREVLALRRAGLVSSGPVLLRPSHLWALLKRPWGLLSILLALVAAAGLVSFSDRYRWSTGVILIVGLALTLVTILLIIYDQQLLKRRNRA